MIFLLILFVPLLFYVGVNLYAITAAAKQIFSPEQVKAEKLSADAVLGAGVRMDRTPSNMLEDRLLCALDLFREGVSDCIVVSGDHKSADYDEVNVMKDYLVKNGVPSDRVFMDHAGFSTYDSLYRAKEIFGAESLVIVTQEYHMHRALMIGRHLSLECKGVSAPIATSDATRYVGQSWYSLRESVARCKDFLFCLFHAEAAVLGDPIPLSGSGDITNDRS